MLRYWFMLGKRALAMIGFFGGVFAMVGADRAEADTQVSVTARNWNLFHSFSFYDPQNEFQETEQAFFIPMLGGSVTVSGDWLPANSSLSLTVLNGRGDRKFSENQFNPGNPVPFNAGHINGYDKVDRTDIEAIWQFPVGMEGANLFVGARYITFQQERFITDQTNSLGVVDNTFFKFDDIDVQSYYVEFGGGLSDALDEGKRHLLFGNLTLSLGREEQDVTFYNQDGSFNSAVKSVDTVFGIDTNFGYAFRPTDDTTLSLRYRLFVAGPADGWGRDGSSVVHGPELQISHRF